MTSTTKTAAIEFLRAVEIPETGWAYHADEINAWVVVREDDILDLGARLERDEDDAYSLWCAATIGIEIPDEEVGHRTVEDIERALEVL